MSVSGMLLLTVVLNDAVIHRQAEEASRRAHAVLAETQKLLQENARLFAETERLRQESDRQELQYLAFVRQTGPRLHPEHAELLYQGAEESRKKYGQPPFDRPWKK